MHSAAAASARGHSNPPAAENGITDSVIVSIGRAHTADPAKTLVKVLREATRLPFTWYPVVGLLRRPTGTGRVKRPGCNLFSSYLGKRIAGTTKI
jgi:hypothetical protein